MNDTMKKLFFLIAASFFLTSVDAQIKPSVNVLPNGSI